MKKTALILTIIGLGATQFCPVSAQTVSGGKLATRWDKSVSATNPLPEYPRPQMVRSAWISLNGMWDYAIAGKTSGPDDVTYAGKIRVPYPLESALSGVQHASIPDQKLWYRRSFEVPEAWKSQRVLLHLDAVNWDSSVQVNGKQVASHRGGYDGFSADITDSLVPGENILTVSAYNPLLADRPEDQVLGKQRIRPGGIFYTAATGIWRSVWMEAVPASHFDQLKIVPDLDGSSLKLTALTVKPRPEAGVQVTVLSGKTVVATGTGQANGEISVKIPSPRIWTPESPFLYSLKVKLLHGNVLEDSVDSYFAMRKVSLGKDASGRTRILLNNQMVFQVGALDQGYWPDGIYTAPTDAALRYDIEAAKRFGLNLLRKHAKVEPDRWYYWADRLGMLVWQDMPQGFGPDNRISPEGKLQFETELRRLIAGYSNHPSIIVWTVYNEGWGQHDTAQMVDLVKQLDPTRLVNNASGWTDMKCGDIADTHAYPGPWSGKAEANRAAVNGEFGGVTMRVPGHMWTSDVFGYGTTLKDAYVVTKRYQALLKNAYRLQETQGCSAVVYTQLTDVEQESNGLMTYDRAVIKPDIAIVAAANQGRFPALPPNPNPDLVPTSADEPQTWLYTTDRPAPSLWMTPGFDASGWKTGQAGFGHEVGTIRTSWTTDDIWLRREITLPANIPAKLAFLCFHDEDVEIYINGVLAGSAPGFVSEYATLPMNADGRAALKPGKNMIAVHCHQTIGGQYIDVGITKAAD